MLFSDLSSLSVNSIYQSKHIIIRKNMLISLANNIPKRHKLKRARNQGPTTFKTRHKYNYIIMGRTDIIVFLPIRCHAVLKESIHRSIQVKAMLCLPYFLVKPRHNYY